MQIGSFYEGNGFSSFTVWAPLRSEVELLIVDPLIRDIKMERDEMGYWHARHVQAGPGSLYMYKLDGGIERPDPASRFQPKGVHGPSCVVDQGEFIWNDSHWKGSALKDAVIYELHTGTFTKEGTFEACGQKLDYLKELGVTAIEIMPVAQFPGERNWGYDGAYPFAVQESYGGPSGLKRLVDRCHQKGLAVVLDVVYNHLGPEGTYLRDYGPYFTEEYGTPWGSAVNFDEAYSYGARNYFTENVLLWFRDYHIDALRLDAVHGIYDFGALHVLAEMARKTNELSRSTGKKYHLIAESDLNDVRIVTPHEKNGHGLDAQWSDDFHHALHTMLTGEADGYYEDFVSMGDLCKAYNEGFVYSWRYSKYRKRFHGSDSSKFDPSQFVVYIQNHDQTGNRMLGERLSSLVSFDALKLAASAVILSPYIPMLFMGEEFAAATPFQYFISHTDKELVRLVREGRAREFAAFGWKGDPPDPQSVETFNKCKLDWESARTGRHGQMLEFYRELLSLRKSHPALKGSERRAFELFGENKSGVLCLSRWNDDVKMLVIMNFNKEKAVSFTGDDVRVSGGSKKLIDSQDKRWGSGQAMPDEINGGASCSLAPLSAAAYELM
ncbi:MAG: malto-oligosyltrehalose trehalohydrolase [Chitinispirillales bacterium]|jgi:maltooligosyltrehalose trehalohydrolase|nr:malto-oligosyltrehalose trehalohydrolase [Chitinispirillales bacterium]